MTETLKFELVSPERKLASVEAEAVTIPGMQGDLTAMANHAPFLTNLRPGYVVVRNGSSEDGYFVTGGFAEISGKRSLVSRGEIDLGATKGQTGTLLYDPLRIEMEPSHLRTCFRIC